MDWKDLRLVDKMKIGLEITHLCNRHCKLCDHRIGTSKFTYLTKEEYKSISQMLQVQYIERIKIIGGEPLVHPHFHWLVEEIRKDFPKSDLVLMTNGTLLDKITEDEWDIFARVEVSKHIDNQDVINKHIHRKNLFIHNSICMWNPNDSPNFDIKTAKKYNKMCFGNEPRIVGTKLYGCPMAEGIERNYPSGKIHVEMNSNWLEEFRLLPTYNACRYCFQAKKMSKEFGFKFKHIVASFLLKHDVLYSIYKKLRNIYEKTKTTDKIQRRGQNE